MDTLYLAPPVSIDYGADLCLDSSGNIAVAGAPYALAQDAGSACATFLGECYYDTSLGIPYASEVLGHNAPLNLLRAQMVAQALFTPGVVAAQVFFSDITNRVLSGQLQVTDTNGVITAVPILNNQNPALLGSNGNPFILNQSLLG